MTSQIADLNKRYDSLKIDYDKMSAQRAPTVQASNVNWRDQHGGYGDQTTKVDQKAQAATAAAGAAPKKTATIAPKVPKQTQTYTGTASL